MGFVRPSLPDVDTATWADRPLHERIRLMVVDWAQSGFGTPDAVYLLYLLKIGLYVLGGLWFASLTPGIGGLGELGDWWGEPVVFQKVVTFTLLFEILGFGCGFGPLTLRFLPPLGTFLHWLRPGTIRLPPWPGRVPLTGGDTRTLADVALYAAVLASGTWLLLSPATGEPIVAGSTVGVLAPERIAVLLAALALVGLRDKVIFLAGRTEVYGSLLVASLLTGADVVVASKVVFLLIWWGAATSKLNGHFPHVVAVMMSNSPILRNKRLKRGFHEAWPDDIRPSRRSRALAHGGTVVEFTVPLVLFASTGGWATTVAAIVMIAFHVHIITALPMGVPLEWNVFMIFGIGVLFVEHAAVGLGDVEQWWAVGAVAAGLLALIAAGNAWPARFSFLVSMRYYAGNWATSLYCFTPEAVEKFETRLVKSASLPSAQLERLYGPDTARLLFDKVYAFRSMHTHGRALFGLLDRTCGPDAERTYTPMDGEFVAGCALGWNFGEGHLHHEQLLAALQARCAFEPGELRVIHLESQPMGHPHQEYRLLDAATGELERGTVAVADMLARQAWDRDIPVRLAASG
jgi:hypothetical protein